MAGNDDPQNWQNTGFSQQQWTALQGLLRSVSGPPGERGPPGLNGLDATVGNAQPSRWNPSDVGFFNPMYEDKSIASGASPMEHTPKETYFRDVHIFLEHARDVASIKGEELVRTNIA